MFTRHFRERDEHIVTLKGISDVGLKLVLDYLYTGTVILQADLIDVALQASQHLALVEFVDFCADFLMQTVSIDNCFRYLELAELYDLKDAAKHLKAYVAANFGQACQREAFYLLRFETLRELLMSQRDIRSEDENQIVQSVLSWIRWDLDTRQHFACQLLQHVCFTMLTAEQTEHVLTSDILRANSDCEEIFRSIFKYHTRLFAQPLLDSDFCRMRNDRQCLLVLGGIYADEVVSAEFVVNVRSADINVSNGDLVAVPNHELARLPRPHYHAEVAVVNNFLFLVGGENARDRNGKYAVNTAFRYNPRDNHWLQISSMTRPRTRFSLLFIAPDTLLAVGGVNAEGFTDTAEKYDFATNSWMRIARLPFPLYLHSGCGCQHRGYVSGGTIREAYSNNLLSYNPENNVWSPKANMLRRRAGHRMTSHGNRLFVIGGYTQEDVARFHVSTTEVFDIATNQWTELSSTPIPVFSPCVTLLDNMVYVFGGENLDLRQRVNAIQAYDLKEDKWLVLGARLPKGIAYGSACALRVPRVVIASLPEDISRC